MPPSRRDDTLIAWKTFTYRSVIMAIMGVLALLLVGFYFAFPDVSKRALLAVGDAITRMADRFSGKPAPNAPHVGARARRPYGLYEARHRKPSLGCPSGAVFSVMKIPWRVFYHPSWRYLAGRPGMPIPIFISVAPAGGANLNMLSAIGSLIFSLFTTIVICI